MRRRIVTLASLVLLGWVASNLFRGGGNAAAPDHVEAPVPVVLGKVEQSNVPIYLSGIGTVQAYNTVAIKSRVDGQLVELRFREGQDVAAGDVLAILDKRPLEANLKQMQANLQKSRSQLVNARTDLGRFQALKEYTSGRSVDTQQALVAQYEAQVASDEAQVEYARTQLSYATITSPIAGRTGIRQVDAGNIVSASASTPIVTVSQLRPISVVFTLNADDLPAIDQGPAAQTLPVVVYAKDNLTELAIGTLDLVDNQINQTTGTVKLKASFANENSRLWPGQFVNARLRVTVRRAALNVPAAAVQQGPSGPYVWVITPGGAAEMTPVTVSRIEDGKALVDSGVKAGQAIVIDGHYKLKPGSKVEPSSVSQRTPEKVPAS